MDEVDDLCEVGLVESIRTGFGLNSSPGNGETDHWRSNRSSDSVTFSFDGYSRLRLRRWKRSMST